MSRFLRILSSTLQIRISTFSTLFLIYFLFFVAMIGERIVTNIANVRERCKFSFTIVLGIDHTVNLLPSSDPGVVG